MGRSIKSWEILQPSPVVGIGYIVFLSQLLLYDRLDDAFQ